LAQTAKPSIADLGNQLDQADQVHDIKKVEEVSRKLDEWQGKLPEFTALVGGLTDLDPNSDRDSVIMPTDLGGIRTQTQDRASSSAGRDNDPVSRGHHLSRHACVVGCRAKLFKSNNRIDGPLGSLTSNVTKDRSPARSVLLALLGHILDC
jgi:hypothetical protein